LGSETNEILKRDMNSDIPVLINRKTSFLTGCTLMNYS